MNSSRLSELKIDPERKRRRGGPARTIFGLVALAVFVAAYFAWSGSRGESRTAGKTPAREISAASAEAERASDGTVKPSAPASVAANSALTISGYIVNRERIEISPRFQGMVKWIGVKKGDPVKQGQVVVLLDDAEQRAQLAQAEARRASARVALERAELNHRRVRELWDREVASKEAEDEARLAVEAANAAIAEIDGQVALAKTYLEWTVIKSPIDGVVLEKLTEPGELVTPQSFGGTRGPSTAVLAVADPHDLQVEIDVNESDLAKISLGQECRVSPEAYPDRSYKGIVAEISPEANRSKGTLQIKVQIENPDRFLTPELTAKVDFGRN